jgi:tagatose-1,6-bisphosphate aldolase
VVVASARRITAIDGVDVLKAEFPGTADAPRDWLAACESLNEASHVPWVLLSGGVDFESFARRAEVACISGASGLLAGRAVWNESVSMAAADRSRFYRTVGARRMARLREIVETSVTRPLPIEMGADPGSGPTFEGPIDR